MTSVACGTTPFIVFRSSFSVFLDFGGTDAKYCATLATFFIVISFLMASEFSVHEPAPTHQLKNSLSTGATMFAFTMCV